CLGGSREETTMSASSSTTRRRFLAGTSAALAVGAATACGGSRSAPDALTMWTFLDPAGASGREQVLGSLIEAYEKKTGIRVEVEVQQWDTMTQQFLAADVSSSAPDIMWLALDQVATAIEQGALADLRSEEHTSELQSRFDLVCRLLLEK